MRLHKFDDALRDRRAALLSLLFGRIGIRFRYRNAR
jgi:hypothetical protein